MKRIQPQSTPEFREVVYSAEHWELLKTIRRRAAELLGLLVEGGVNAYIHGSVARGDVWRGSDIDVFIPDNIPSYIVETLLEKHGVKPYARMIVMATPVNTPKAYIVMDSEERETISFPLLKLKPREYEFYRFSGLLDYRGLVEGRRVPGVNKALILIDPTPSGHQEIPVKGFEEYVARRLGVSLDTVLERERVLTRRSSIGRTGVFIKYQLTPDESFEDALRELSRGNIYLRRMLSSSE
ncbi:nucleotidyltransferase domain-containing protein [Desulfurococcus mucosus]|uniref:DNA polymerase beta domain protein region n=1 Tax=Desulfurococcus mucosus (strain ATCC 35584 / DSM 2162 / JCM 9187 / O7/1) TaxID=765177 RepID=E8R7B4_DESM0|nr:nucleotidyltransferase domain-containing protein [Desulfurococcus mucosus]ADV65579.1 DNA polymerase beta domain protein region [Desulfurococcus mucosus DSM 2162]